MISSIFEFNNGDHELCGYHECGYSTDKSIFIRASVYPEKWKIRKAPRQLTLTLFTEIIDGLKNLQPIPNNHGTDWLYPNCFEYDCRPPIFLNSKYVRLVKMLGCALHYQDIPTQKDCSYYASPLAIMKNGEIVGVLMPMKV